MSSKTVSFTKTDLLSEAKRLYKTSAKYKAYREDVIGVDFLDSRLRSTCSELFNTAKSSDNPELEFLQICNHRAYDSNITSTDRLVAELLADSARNLIRGKFADLQIALGGENAYNS